MASGHFDNLPPNCHVHFSRVAAKPQFSYDKLKEILKYQGEINGIKILEQEESYTSKASLPDRDYISNLGEDGILGKRGCTGQETG